MVITTTMTAEDLWRMPATEWHQELWEGRLVEMAPPGPAHGGIAVALPQLLKPMPRSSVSGVVMAEAGFTLERNPDTVFGPDISFVRAERVPPSGLPVRFWEGPPDLAVEVRSPSNSAPDIQRKVALYLRAGTRLVWVVDPARQQVTVHAAGDAARTLVAQDVLDGGDVLPGFRVPVAELFDLGLLSGGG